MAEIDEKKKRKKRIKFVYTIREWVFTDIRLETISREKERGMKKSRKWEMKSLYFKRRFGGN